MPHGHHQTVVHVRDNSNSIRIVNMPLTSNEHDLRVLARKCPGSGEMYLAKDKVTKEFKGCAYIHFKSRKDAENGAHTLNGLNYKNNILRVACATGGG